MGVLTDFVVANADDAKRLGDHREAFEGVDAKGIDHVRMGSLYALLTGTDRDPTFLLTNASLVYAASDDGPWVQVIPDDMVRRLGELSPAEIGRIANEWSQTEEFDPKYLSWSRGELAKLLADLQRLSNRAVTEGKVLYMWMCL